MIVDLIKVVDVGLIIFVVLVLLALDNQVYEITVVHQDIHTYSYIKADGIERIVKVNVDGDF